MLLAAAGLHLGAAEGWFTGRSQSRGRRHLAAIVLLIFFSLNLLLGTFNLLPLAPLDGSTAILLFHERKDRTALSGLAPRQ